MMNNVVNVVLGGGGASVSALYPNGKKAFSFDIDGAGRGFMNVYDEAGNIMLECGKGVGGGPYDVTTLVVNALTIRAGAGGGVQTIDAAGNANLAAVNVAQLKVGGISVLTGQMLTVTQLDPGTATLADVITAINLMITKLTAVGLMAAP